MWKSIVIHLWSLATQYLAGSEVGTLIKNTPNACQTIILELRGILPKHWRFFEAEPIVVVFVVVVVDFYFSQADFHSISREWRTMTVRNEEISTLRNRLKLDYIFKRCIWLEEAICHVTSQHI